MEHVVDRVAEWLDDISPSDESSAPEIWACVEVFGHRKHYGRISETERFWTKFLRVDVPVQSEAPLLGEAAKFETHIYGGAAIFSITPMTEEAARKWAGAERAHLLPACRPLDRLPPPDPYEDDDDDQPF